LESLQSLDLRLLHLSHLLEEVNCKTTMIFTVRNGWASAAEESEGVSPGCAGLQQLGCMMVTTPSVCAQEVKERC